MVTVGTFGTPADWADETRLFNWLINEFSVVMSAVRLVLTAIIWLWMADTAAELFAFESWLCRFCNCVCKVAIWVTVA